MKVSSSPDRVNSSPLLTIDFIYVFLIFNIYELPALLHFAVPWKFICNPEENASVLFVHSFFLLLLKILDVHHPRPPATMSGFDGFRGAIGSEFGVKPREYKQFTAHFFPERLVVPLASWMFCGHLIFLYRKHFFFLFFLAT